MTTRKTEIPKVARFVMLAKLSTATVFGEIKVKDLVESKEPIKIMQVYGIAKKIITGHTTFGDWMGFIGSFEAVNLSTGVKYASGKCFLPVNITSLLAGEFTQDIDSVRFGYEISACFNEKNACKYEYTVSTLIKPKEDNPIAQLRNEVEKEKADETDESKKE